MESSIAVFLWRQPARERLPTNVLRGRPPEHAPVNVPLRNRNGRGRNVKLTWLVLGGDPAARSHRVEQFTAL